MLFIFLKLILIWLDDLIKFKIFVLRYAHKIPINEFKYFLSNLNIKFICLLFFNYVYFYLLLREMILSCFDQIILFRNSPSIYKNNVKASIPKKNKILAGKSNTSKIG